MNVDAGMGTDALAEAVIVSEKSGDQRDPHYAPEDHGICANCETPLTGAYCHVCGQSAHIHRSLLHMVEELLHGIFHFETKAWKTIPALILTPGKLTRNYIAGQRTRYVSPLALFLFLIFLMFFVFSLTSDHSSTTASKDLVAEKADLNKDLKLAKEKLQVLTQKRASLPEGDQALEDINDEINSTVIEITAIEMAGKANGDKTSLAKNKSNDQTVSAENKETDQEGQSTFDLNIDDKNMSSSVPWIEKRLRHAAENPELTLYKMKSAASKFAFLLMPISLPFLWLMFALKRKYVMFDHAVFSLYSLCFMAILMMLITVLGKFNLTAIAGLITVLVPPVHMFIQLRGTYDLTNMEALWRTVALLFIAMISLILYALIVAGLST
ncbi:DUF3667 domain-containing protein [Undibacterium sp. MH2W]|uniref:DUF3667 domain-containing protein n=1 Tax=Undibacterium sp. MH2W TaxID=3413044 RepID=UPI003BF0A855